MARMFIMQLPAESPNLPDSKTLINNHHSYIYHDMAKQNAEFLAISSIISRKFSPISSRIRMAESKPRWSANSTKPGGFNGKSRIRSHGGTAQVPYFRQKLGVYPLKNSPET